MKKLIFILSLLPILSLGQVNNQNYTVKITYKVPTTTPITTYSVENVNAEVVYYDGLGRPIQQIAHQQSVAGNDIIVHIEYDQFGRQIKEYLPYTGKGTPLGFFPNAKIDQSTFYSNPDFATTRNPNFEATSNPYSEKELENSPLGRVYKQAAPGNDWIMGNGKEIKFDYQTNVDSGIDAVKLFKANSIWNSSLKIYDVSISQNSNYGVNQLYVTITKDENWVSGKNNTTEEFKDKSGKVVLKRTYNNSEAHDTYYVYDQFGNLSYVLPPLSDKSLTQSDLDNLCYQYKYDSRNRLVEKKLPGKQWEYIVYNSQDMPVATGPAYNPWGATSETDTGWLITKYDALNRVIYTGWYTGREVTAIERQKYQTEQSILASPYEEVFDSNTIDNITIDYTNKVLPLTSFKVLTINYYDTYNYPNAPTIPSTLPHSTFSIASSVKGLPTGNWVRVLDDPNNTTSESSYTIYDNKFRPVRSHTTNYLGGYTQVDTNLDWVGKTLYTYTEHVSQVGGTPIVVKDFFEYTIQDRLNKHYQQINNLYPQLIALNTYDELGQLISKKVGSEDIEGGDFYQKVDYSYNIRGWLKSINQLDDLETENDFFAFKISYNTPTDPSKKLFNGNISETYWQTSSDNKVRKYDYSYDHLNRLLQANYSKEGNTSYNSYLEQITYDKAGNILSLLRNGDMDTDGMQFENLIDELEYTYHPDKKNQLAKVFDWSVNPQGFKDDGDGVNMNLDTDDFVYDLNGNMISDENKGITQIIYNHLNLPTNISFGLNGEINYLYNAAGSKVRKGVIDENLGSHTDVDYLNGFQYKGGILQFFPHAEGYVNATQNFNLGGDSSYDFNYVFNYTDHLGNIRLSYGYDPLTNSVRIMEENHYYPFGLKHTKYNSDQLLYAKSSTGTIGLKRPLPTVPVDPAYKYKYNGKELQDELGLNMYDYGARNYDPALGRWMNIDPLAEIYRRWSPYNYVMNSPMIFVDPDGMGVEDLRFRSKSGTTKDASRSALDKTEKVINDGLGGSYAKIDKDGKLTLDVKREDLKTDEQKGLFDILNKAMTAEKDVNIDVVESDNFVMGGAMMAHNESAAGVIDIDDIMNFGSGELINSASSLGHEVAETYEKQINGNTDYVNDEGTGAHQKANVEESKVNGGWVAGKSKVENAQVRTTLIRRPGRPGVTGVVRSGTIKTPLTKDGQTRVFTYQVKDGNVVKKP